MLADHGRRRVCEETAAAIASARNGHSSASASTAAVDYSVSRARMREIMPSVHHDI